MLKVFMDATRGFLAVQSVFERQKKCRSFLLTTRLADAILAEEGGDWCWILQVELDLRSRISDDII